MIILMERLKVLLYNLLRTLVGSLPTSLGENAYPNLREVDGNLVLLPWLGATVDVSPWGLDYA
jgi:hypothetical protein